MGAPAPSRALGSWDKTVLGKFFANPGTNTTRRVGGSPLIPGGAPGRRSGPGARALGRATAGPCGAPQPHGSGRVPRSVSQL